MDDEKECLNKMAIWEHRKIMLKSFLKNKTAVVGLIIVVGMIALGILAPVIAPEGPYKMNVANRLAAPSEKFVFGTDKMGRDLFTRILYGIQISLLVGAVTTVVTFVIGMMLGLLAGFFSKLDNTIMRFCEGLTSIPPVLMAIALMSAFSPNIQNVVVSLCIVYAPAVARVARSATLSVREQTYIEAVRSQGARPLWILIKHIAPNTLSSVIVQSTYIFATAITLEASLSFLGAGIPAPAPSLGNILYEAKGVIFNSWWMTLYPGIAMILLVLGINVLGDGIRDVLDPMS